MIVTWSPLAVARVSEIAKYIARENQSAASKWIGSILSVLNNWSLSLRVD
jgi:plasmid stabilization system protein ParE